MKKASKPSKKDQSLEARTKSNGRKKLYGAGGWETAGKDCHDNSYRWDY
jgi:hypothetical protein